MAVILQWDTGAPAPTTLARKLDRKEISIRIRASDHGLHANAFPHSEGCRAAHGEAKLWRNPHAVNTGIAPVGSGVHGHRRGVRAIETFSRILAGELGPSGIRVICLRPDAIPEAVTTSHTHAVFSGLAERAGTTVEAMLAERARTATLLKRLPTLAEVANFAAFVASDRASAMTGAIVNPTCGSLVD